MSGQDCGICLGFRGCLGGLLDPCSDRPFVSLPVASHSKRCSVRGYSWPCSNCVVVATCGLFAGLESVSHLVLDNLRASTHSQIHSGWNPRLDDSVVRVLSSCGPSAHRFQCRDVFLDGTGHVARVGLFGTRHSQFASAGRRLCLALLSVAHGVVKKNKRRFQCCGTIQHPIIIVCRMDRWARFGSIHLFSVFFTRQSQYQQCTPPIRLYLETNPRGTPSGRTIINGPVLDREGGRWQSLYSYKSAPRIVYRLRNTDTFL